MKHPWTVWLLLLPASSYFFLVSQRTAGFTNCSGKEDRLLPLSCNPGSPGFFPETDGQPRAIACRGSPAAIISRLLSSLLA